MDHYLIGRPRQREDIRNALLIPPYGTKQRSKATTKETLALCDVRCHTRHRGLVKHYERKAA